MDIHLPLVGRLRSLLLSIFLTAVAVFLVVHHGFATTSAGPTPAPMATSTSPVEANQLAITRPNESGCIPILEYHNIVDGGKVGTYEYPSSEFKKDLEWLYTHNYRPIRLSDYVNGWIDCPAGMSPVIITFDDALEGQFRYLSDGSINPNCAVAILDQMNVEHPDWKSTATFFVLTNEDPKLPAPFTSPHLLGSPQQKPFAKMKMEYLIQNGYDIGNHTLDHSFFMKSMSDAQVEAQFAGGERGIDKYVPGYDVDTLALPYGVFPKDLSTLKTGFCNGVTYHNICAMAAGCQPAPSPMSNNFQPYRVPRIIPGNNIVKPGGLFTIRYWLNQLELHPSEKFISDGDPQTYTVPSHKKRLLNLAKLGQDHFVLRVYSE